MATGVLTQIGQDDWLAVTLAANEAVAFTFTGLTDFQNDAVGNLATIDPAGNAEVLNGGTVNAEYAFFTAPTAGTYYVSVSDSGAAIPADYAVSAQTVTPDYANNPTTTGVVAVNGTATTGTLTSIGQDDWLAVSLVANQAYEFALTDSNGASQLTVGALAVATSTVATAAYALNTTGTEDAFFRPTATGTYYVDVSGGYGGVPDSYSVTAQTVSTDVTDNTTTTGRVTVGAAATTGTLTEVGQHDWLAVSLTANQAYAFKLTDSDDLASITVGALTPATMRTGAPPGSSLSNPGTEYAFFRPTTTGTYYVDVSDEAGAGSSYAVSATAVSTDYTNNPTTTGTIVVGAAATTGTLTNIGQDDWLAVSLTANQAYEFTLNGLSEYAFAAIGSLDPATAATSLPVVSYGTSATSYAFFRPTTSGVYYVDAGEGYDGGIANTGSAVPYSVAAQTVTTDYTNNATTAATLVVGGAPATVTLTNIGQDDWVAVNLVANQAYEFTLAGKTASGYLTVGSLAGLLADETESTVPTAGAAGTVEAFFRPTATGTYYIDIADGAAGSRAYAVSAAAVTTDYTDNPTTTGVVGVDAAGASANPDLPDVSADFSPAVYAAINATLAAIIPASGIVNVASVAAGGAAGATVSGALNAVAVTAAGAGTVSTVPAGYTVAYLFASAAALRDTNGGVVLIGAAGGSTLVGAANDTLFGGNAGMTLQATSGAETLSGGTGANLIELGNATAVANTEGADVVVGSSQPATINSAGATTYFGAAGATVFNVTGGAATLVGGTDETINAQASSALVFGGSGGSLAFNAGSGASTVVSGVGSNATVAGGSAGMLYFGNGSTTYQPGTAVDTILGFTGSLTATGGANGALFFTGTAGGSVVTSGSGAATIVGLGTNDLLSATGSANTIIEAAAAAETINAAASSGQNDFFAFGAGDLVLGGSNNTAIESFLGDQTLVGGSGTTLFEIVSSGQRSIVINGFNVGTDFVQLPGYAAGAAAAALSTATTNATGAEVLTLSDGTQVIFNGLAGLTPGSFI